MTNQPIHHEAHLGTGNGVVQFVCCGRTERPFDVLWTAPGGTEAANVFHTPRQAYDMVVRHLTTGRLDDASLATILEDVDPGNPDNDVRPSIEFLAEKLDAVTLEVRVR